MKIKTLLFLVTSIVLAGTTAFIARNWLVAERDSARAQAAPRPADTSVQVLVAKSLMPAGSIVREEHLAWQPWPKDGVSREYLVAGKADRKAVVGAVVRIPVAAGQPVTLGQVIQPGDRGFLAAMINPGMRAVSVPINATSGIAGFVFPGDCVDVLLTLPLPTPEGAPRRYATETLLSEIRVLAIDQTAESKDAKVSVPKTATVEVDPKQAEKIALALQMGTLSFALRSMGERDSDFEVAGGPDGDEAPKPAPLRVEQSVTVDHEILFLKPSHQAGPKTGPIVNVLRGEKAERAAF